mmetsp:Transcript_4976/g.11058  ORF Transcript_4976/g.11058 Transcript_4976/m.11058 type:complete len:254 (+) Transcript_4976:78-839(+)
MTNRYFSSSAARFLTRSAGIGPTSSAAWVGVCMQHRRAASHLVVAPTASTLIITAKTLLRTNPTALGSCFLLVSRKSSSSSSSGPAGVSDRGGAILPGFDDPSATAIHLPRADDPVGMQLYKKAIYCPVSQTLRTSMHVGTTDENTKADGIVGATVTPDQARIYARNSGLRLLATIHQFLDGDLDRVEQVLHLRGMIKSTPEFVGHASVIDGCSDVLREAFGPEIGVGTRECLGVGSLGAAVACTLELRIQPL